MRSMDKNQSAYAAGAKAAAKDIAASRLVYRWSGHAGPWGHWIVTELNNRFSVGVSAGFGVCFTSDSEHFDDGYNSALAAEIDRRHGTGAFDGLFNEARQRTQETLWAAKQAWLTING